MDILKLLKSFSYAFRGILVLFKKENNARFHLLAMLIVLVLGIWMQLDKWEWVVCIIAIGIVMAAESFNTAIEKLCDLVQPEFSESIRNIKDISAGAVLWVAISAFIVGVLVFGPRFMQLLFI